MQTVPRKWIKRLQSSHDHNSCSGPPYHTCLSPAHVHTSAVGTVAIVEQGSVDLSLVNKWLASILWPNQDEDDAILRARLEEDFVPEQETYNEMKLFRIKGILSCHAQDEDSQYVDDSGLDTRRFIVQAVHDLWEIHPASDDLQWDPGEARTCKLVLIGRFLRQDDLRAGFKSCFVYKK